MYFVPRTNRLNRYMHIRPIYRYGIFFASIFILCFVWRYSLYIWLDAAIVQEQATICQLQQQFAQHIMEERRHDELLKQIPVLKNVCMQGVQCCIGTNCRDQCAYIFAEVQKSGLHMLGYHAEKDKKKNDGKQCQSILISLRGTLDQIELFLTSLKKSARLVQCTSLSMRHVEDKLYTMECNIQFITYT